MAKRVDNDSTMELSTSQLVPDKPDHDASVWGQVVVDADQFAPKPAAPGKPAKLPAAAKPVVADESIAPARSGSRLALWLGIVFVLVTAIAAMLIVVYAK